MLILLADLQNRASIQPAPTADTYEERRLFRARLCRSDAPLLGPL